MKILSLTSIFTATIIGFLNLSISNLSAKAQTPNFFCGKIGTTPATIANKQGNNIPIILWSANNYFAYIKFLMVKILNKLNKNY